MRVLDFTNKEADFLDALPVSRTSVDRVVIPLAWRDRRPYMWFYSTKGGYEEARALIVPLRHSIYELYRFPT